MTLLRSLTRIQSALASGGGSEGNTSGSSGGGGGGAFSRFLARFYGWPPAKLDPGRDTAWLDGLRGVAAFLVLTYHYHLEWWTFYLEAPYGAKPEHWMQIWRLPFLRIFFCAGHAQVSVFFVLSGFVLSWSPLASVRRGQADKLATTLSSATFRRWLRLYVPCFAVGLWSILELKWGLIDPPTIAKKDTILGQLWDYVKACERFADPLKIDRAENEFLHAYNWTMWTIPHEFAGSLLVFLLVLSVSRIRDYTRRTIVISSVTIICMLKARWTYWLFTYGVLLADYIRQNGGFIELHNPAARLGWGVVMVFSLWLAGVPEHSPFYDRPGYEFLDSLVPSNYKDIETGGRYWWCWAGILFVTSACHLVAVRRIFESSFTRYLGRVSYMLYVTHRVCYECVGRSFRQVLSNMFMTQKWSEELKANYFTAGPIIGILLWILSWTFLGPFAIFVAHWCEVFIDAPSVRLAKWVDQGFVKGFGAEKTANHEEMVRLTAQEEATLTEREPRIA
ncbi:acyltransferase, class 3 [Myriangium duriaei CBS 260.36]|uniref:Acyltransferase, class 3 n=1 Tax=Myriangium duriaei CBS 260.36 TaxID=1168546 RepID=A0A9P4MH03_9PEZI|nr:acyltransferase, class 3 [Myriangium duriaei CBS 260.36]